MKKKILDFLSRRPVRVIMPVKIEDNEYVISHKLPEDFTLENGFLRFTAGYVDSYFVNGKEYNVDHNRSLDEQKELISKDLKEQGFARDEINEFIDNIEVKEWSILRLDLSQSYKWLDAHPEFKDEALLILNKAREEANSEMKLETKRKIR